MFFRLPDSRVKVKVTLGPVQGQVKVKSRSQSGDL